MDNLLFKDDTSGQIAQGATVIPRAASSLWCPVCPGISVQFALERVSSLPWNQCPLSRGIGVQFAAEYARAYLESAEALLARVRETRVHLVVSQVPAPFLEEIDLYLGDAERQIGQIRRRVLLGQTIPHGEKLFSIFQRHTEWRIHGSLSSGALTAYSG